MRINPKTGLLAYEGEEDAIEELFLQGTEPQMVSTPSAAVPDGGAAVTPGAGLAEGTDVAAERRGALRRGRAAAPTPPVLRR